MHNSIPNLTSALLVSSTLAAAGLLPRQQTDANSSSPEYRDPHLAPPVTADYPFGPIANGGVAWGAAFGKAKGMVDQMTVEEKVNVTTGFPGPCEGNTGSVERLGIPAFCLQDGPLGVRPVDLVSQFPAGVTTAATWDHDLFYARALAIGQEFVGKGVNIALAPVTGGPIGRSPLGGRNWEGFAPDVYLNSIGAKLTVSGMLASGIMTTSKHYLAYEQEFWRTSNSPANTNLTARFQQIDSFVDDKTVHELYLPGFAEAVRAGTSHVMSSYNSINGTHASQNGHTLNTLLKGELNFQGSVISDWGGTWGTEEDAAAGLDMTMPGTGDGGWAGNFFDGSLVEAVKAGVIPESRLTDMAIRILTPYYQQGQDSGYPETNYDYHTFASEGDFIPNQHVNVQADHYKVIQQIAEQANTLLKNDARDGKGLPISSSIGRIGVFGDDAGPNPTGLTGAGQFVEYFPEPSDFSLSLPPSVPSPIRNGTVTVGGGSGANIPTYIVTPLEAIQARFRHTDTTVDFELNREQDNWYYVDTVASNVDKAIVFVEAFQTEGYDRKDLELAQNGSALINRVAESCSDVVVVVHSGQQVNMESWIENENVTAVVWAYYPGQESGNSIVPVLMGDVSPSGKLPFTIGKTIDDYPGGRDGVVSADVAQPNSTFDEGVFIDYKWFDQKNIEPRFEFGFGLSYSNFTYSMPTVKPTPSADKDYVQLTNEPFEGEGGLYDVLYTVGVTVTNSGKLEAAEVAQVYMTFPSAESDQPIRNLRGFCKEKYAVGESQTLTFPIRAKDMTVWSVERQTFYIPKGEFTFSIGSSSRKLPLNVTVQV